MSEFTYAEGRARSIGLPMAGIYTATIFLSAFLLFLVEPMFARMMLPLLGGSSAVWNTAVVFYQIALLAGYLYAHGAIAWLGVRRQSVLNLGLMLLPCLVLPLAIPRGLTPPTSTNPVPWVLLLMLTRVGLPFIILSAGSPMLQKWFASTSHPAAADPYFLYAASNIGSMVALLAYPLLLEPALRLSDQSRWWTAGYVVLVGLVLACALVLWRSARPKTVPIAAPAQVGGTDLGPRAGSLTVRRRARWVLLAFIPSSLMLGVTTYLSTDIPALPLLWVIPLAIYLLGFILAFAKKRWLSRSFLSRALPLLFLPLVLTIALPSRVPIWVVIPLHLATFFVVGLLCDYSLADDRPSADHLTEFYLWISVGGALGGVFNALLAPVLFTSVLEYPLGLILAALVIFNPPYAIQKPAHAWLNTMLPPILAVVMVAIALYAVGTRASAETYLIAALISLPLLISLRYVRRRGLDALRLLAAVLVCVLYVGSQGNMLYAERGFYGINRVRFNPATGTQILIHGETVHGVQSIDTSRRCQGLSYYYSTGPIGQVFSALDETRPALRVGIVGLGAGSLAAYSRPGDDWTFYEIDPSVERIARDPRYFTYLSSCAPRSTVTLGDARLSLAGVATGYHDLLVLDAYSSDAIPVHLITREALALYLEKLATKGIIAFHISNRYFDLRPVLGNLVQDAGLSGLVQVDMSVTSAEKDAGKQPSVWVLIARRQADFGKLAGDPRWKPLNPQPEVGLWTDDFSSVLKAWRWR
jgi:hypothetical protein